MQAAQEQELYAQVIRHIGECFEDEGGNTPAAR